MYSEIAMSNFVPPILTEVLATIPPSDMTAISDVPPPMSIIICPEAEPIGIFAPMAAAMGSLMMKAALAPAARQASITARRSVGVIPAGTATIRSEDHTSELQSQFHLV